MNSNSRSLLLDSSISSRLIHTRNHQNTNTSTILHYTIIKSHSITSLTPFVHAFLVYKYPTTSLWIPPRPTISRLLSCGMTSWFLTALRLILFSCDSSLLLLIPTFRSHSLHLHHPYVAVCLPIALNGVSFFPFQLLYLAIPGISSISCLASLHVYLNAIGFSQKHLFLLLLISTVLYNLTHYPLHFYTLSGQFSFASLDFIST